MTPKERAKELVDKMLNEQSNTEELYDAKQCALIAVYEIIESCNFVNKSYWQEVKQEIERL